MGSVSDAGCLMGGGRCNNFLPRLINWSASASSCPARQAMICRYIFAIIVAVILIVIHLNECIIHQIRAMLVKIRQ